VPDATDYGGYRPKVLVTLRARERIMELRKRDKTAARQSVST